MPGGVIPVVGRGARRRGTCSGKRGQEAGYLWWEEGPGGVVSVVGR